MSHHSGVYSLTLALLVALAAACTDDSTGPKRATETGRALIDGMVPHHEMAVLPAGTAIARMVHPELKTFAGNMKTDQRREVERLKSWKLEWFGA